MANGEWVLKRPNMKQLIDFGGKSLAAAAAFFAGDTFLFGGAITPDPIKGFVGLIVCAGLAVAAWRLVKP